MPIQFNCPKCDKAVRAPENLAGRKVKCPQCGSVVQVPAAEEAEDTPPVRATEPRSSGVRSERGPEPEDRGRQKGRRDRDDVDDDMGDRPRGRMNDDDMDDADDRDAPRARKKQEGRTLNVLGIISICVAILGGALALLPCGIGFISLPVSITAILLGIVGLIIAGANGKWGFITPTIGTVVGIGAFVLPFATCITSLAIFGNRVKQVVSEAQEQIEKQQREAKENLEKGDTLWEEGKKAEAVKLYKENLPRILNPDNKDEKLQRIVDFEASLGHDGEARHWIQIAINEGRTPNYENEKAKKLYQELTHQVQIPGASSSGSVGSSASLADVDMTVDEYVQALRNAVESDKKYHDHFINLTGKLGWYGRQLPAQGSKSFLTFEGFQENFLCPEDKLPSKALPGQTVVLRGKWTHAIFGVEEWKFVSKSGEGPPEIKADDLAKDLAENPEETKKRWADKIIVVSGKIQDTKGGVLLTPPGKEPRVFCWFYAQSLAPPGGAIKFRVGQQIKVVGKFEAPGGQIGICEIVELK